MSLIQSTTIRETPYRVVRLDPLRGGRLAARVGRILAGALSDPAAIQGALKAYKESDGQAISALLDNTELLASLASGAANLDTESLFDVAMEFARGNLFAGDKKLHDDAALSAWFSEHPDHMLLVLVWVLKVNCAGFFGLRAAA
jgi:hypothetical protein